jgi:thiamine-phosphate pyrophosphorylase
MPTACLLYYITDRTALAEDESARRRRLLEKIAEAAHAGVDYIQLREKDLSTCELEFLAREAAVVIQELRTENPLLKTAFLINSRADVALAVGADGVHLRSNDVPPQEVSKIWQAQSPTLRKSRRACPEPVEGVGYPQREGSLITPLIGVSCHSPAEVSQAAANGATFAVFAPVFEKRDSPDVRPTGLIQLQEACRTNIPVFALGGVTLANAAACLHAGAAGIAAIRLFQENDIAELVRCLRERT